MPYAAQPLAAIVDDDLDCARTLAQMLEDLGWASEVYASAASLMQAGQPAAYRAIFLDLSMPEMDGIELIWRFSAMDVHVPLVLVSGHSQSVLAAAQTIALQSGTPTVETLAKPVRARDIAHIVQDIFDAPRHAKDSA